MKKKSARRDRPGCVFNADLTVRAARDIEAAFLWGDTKEGFKYWECIRDRLLKLSEKPKREAKL